MRPPQSGFIQVCFRPAILSHKQESNEGRYARLYGEPSQSRLVAWNNFPPGANPDPHDDALIPLCLLSFREGL
jgi:hypothetical protein